jgi:hypothetical protein
LFSKLTVIYKGLSKQTDSSISTFDLLNNYESAFKAIADLISKVSDPFIVNSIREGKETNYSFINPSMLDETVSILSGNSSSEESKHFLELLKSDE